MALFEYVKKGGGLGTIESASADEAIKLAADIDPNSGVILKSPSAAQTQPSETPAQTEARRLRERETASTSGVTSDSGNLRQLENKLGVSIVDGSKRPSLDLSYIDKQEEALQRRREDTIMNIERDFQSTKATTEQAQRREVGSTSSTLARVGGYLGESASGTGVLQNLASSHRAEMSSLEAKRQAALNAARVAYDEKSFDLAKLKVQEAKSYEADSYKRQQDFFDNTIRALGEERAQAGEERTKQNQVRDDARSAFNTLISSYASDYFNNLTPDDKSKFLSQAKELGVQAGYPETAIEGLLAQSKAEQSKRLQLVQDAAKRGAPQSILSGIATAATFAEAAALAGPYIQKASGGNSPGTIKPDYIPSSLSGLVSQYGANQIFEDLLDSDIPTWFYPVLEEVGAQTKQSIDPSGAVAKEAWTTFKSSQEIGLFLKNVNKKITGTASSGDFGSFADLASTTPALSAPTAEDIKK